MSIAYHSTSSLDEITAVLSILLLVLPRLETLPGNVVERLGSFEKSSETEYHNNSFEYILGGKIHQSSIANSGRQEAPKRHAAPQGEEEESDTVQGAEADREVQA